MVSSTLQSSIIPYDFEREYFPIVIKILLESIIGMSSSQFDLNVLLVLLSIRRINFSVFGPGESAEQVIRQRLRLVERDFHVLIELFGEGIAIIYPEDAFEDVEVDSDVEVLPGVMVGQLADHLGHLLPLEEHALRNAGVFDFLLSDEDGLVGKVVVDLDGSDAVVFESAFDDVLLEVGIEAQHFAIVLEPWRLHPRDVVVFGCLACFLEGEVVDGLAHLVDQVGVDLFLMELPLLLHRPVLEIELLRLVVVLFVGVVEDVSWQEWYLLRDVCLHQLKLYFYLFIHQTIPMGLHKPRLISTVWHTNSFV